MYVNPKSTIAGQPALEIRSILQSGRQFPWTKDLIAKRLSLTYEDAQRVIEELFQLGYVEQDPDPHLSDIPWGPWWRTTVKGNLLALASTIRPLKRSTAERKLGEFLNRVQIVNLSPYYLYKVQRVLLFGSMLTDKNRVSGINLAANLIHKINDPDKQFQADQERREAAVRAGRHFTRPIEELLWPEREVILFLEAHSRGLILNKIDDLILRTTPTKVIFEDTDPLEKRI